MPGQLWVLLDLWDRPKEGHFDVLASVLASFFNHLPVLDTRMVITLLSSVVEILQTNKSSATAKRNKNVSSKISYHKQDKQVATQVDVGVVGSDLYAILCENIPHLSINTVHFGFVSVLSAHY